MWTKALSKIFGDWELSYDNLPQYLDAIKKSNPGTITYLKVEPYALEYGSIVPNIVWFGRIFWAFGTSIEGFPSYHLLLSIDDMHICEKYIGCLLIVTGVDADGGLYSLAFVFVKSESENSWRWFLQFIYNLIPSVHNNWTITLISDRMKELPKALTNAWP